MSQQRNDSGGDLPISLLLLEASHGPLIDTPEFAAELAEVVVAPEGSSADPADHIGNSVDDCGEYWSVTIERKDDTRDALKIALQIAKRDGAVTGFGRVAGPVVLDSREKVVNVATLILRRKFGDDEVQRQRPLQPEDRGASWRVRGSYNLDRAVEGPGPFVLELQKNDARVLDIFFEAVMNIPSDLQEWLRQAMKTSG